MSSSCTSNSLSIFHSILETGEADCQPCRLSPALNSDSIKKCCASLATILLFGQCNSIRLPPIPPPPPPPLCSCQESHFSTLDTMQREGKKDEREKGRGESENISRRHLVGNSDGRALMEWVRRGSKSPGQGICLLSMSLCRTYREGFSQ